MGFASEWIESGSIFPELIKEAPDNDTGIIVVVPAYDEPEINRLLNSLSACSKPNCKTEILIIINAPDDANDRSLSNNLQTLNNIESWKRNNKDHFFRLYSVNIGQPSVKGWGVGLARKAGMDEALRRFNHINRSEGIIVNLDADCIVQDNYFQSLENDFLQKNERKACSIFFEHPLSGSDYPGEIYRAVAQYELHLRYYYQALKYTGFPYVFHTIGSVIAVKALAYVKAGGMNRRQAGEDFYFIQKLVPAGGYFNLTSTTVYPSPRISTRVPFGTGPVIGKMVDRREDHFMTYDPSAFRDLRGFFGKIESSYLSSDQQLNDLFSMFPESLNSFLNKEEWISKIKEIKMNTSGLNSFAKRFFNWFNMFKVVKYLNYAHNSIFKKMQANAAAAELLRYLGENNIPAETIDLLMYYRKMEKEV